MKRWHVLVSVLVVAVFALLLNQDALARSAWQKYRSPAVALALNRGDAELAMQLGNYYFGNGEYDLVKAEKAYRKAVAINLSILWGHYQLARVIFVRGDYNSALDEINRELEANPQNLRSLYVRGLIYGYTGNSVKAAEDFQRFTEWAPSEWAGYNDLAWALSKAGKYSKAEEAVEKAFDKVPYGKQNPWLWNALGLAELNLKKYSEAELSFSKAATFAEKLTEADWQKSYPGNDPKSAEGGLSSFRAAIENNLASAKARNAGK